MVSAFVFWLVTPMTKRRIEPLVWLTFSGGGVIAAIFLPVLAFLFALGLPAGLDRPAGLRPPGGRRPDTRLTFLVLLGLFVPMLVHAAHRFRYTLYDGLQVKHKVLVAMVCYGGAARSSRVAGLLPAGQGTRDLLRRVTGVPSGA